MHARMPALLGRALRQAKESLRVTHQRMHSSPSLPHTALLQLIRQAEERLTRSFTRCSAYDDASLVALCVYDDGFEFPLSLWLLVHYDATGGAILFIEVHFVGHEVGVDGVEGP